MPPSAAELAGELAVVCRAHGVPLLSRGDGTSPAGQCTKTAVVIDWSRYCHRVLDIDVGARTCTVEPGIVLASARPRTCPATATPGRPAAPVVMGTVATAATARPAVSLPVSVAATTRRSRTTLSTTVESISRVWNTPAGKPARSKRRSRYRATCGTLEACLRSPTLPAMSAGAAKRITCQSGKFHGITARTGPRGS